MSIAFDTIFVNIKIWQGAAVSIKWTWNKMYQLQANNWYLTYPPLISVGTNGDSATTTIIRMNNTSNYDPHTWVIGTCNFDSIESRFDVFLYVIIASLALIENTTILAGYLRYRALRTITNTFLVSLTTSDIMVALFSIPYSFGVFMCALLPPTGEHKSLPHQFVSRLLYFCNDRSGLNFP